MPLTEFFNPAPTCPQASRRTPARDAQRANTREHVYSAGQGHWI